MALKGRHRGLRRAVSAVGWRALQLRLPPWLGQSVPPAVWKPRPKKPDQPGWIILQGVERVDSWNGQPASPWLSFKTYHFLSY